MEKYMRKALFKTFRAFLVAGLLCPALFVVAEASVIDFIDGSSLPQKVKARLVSKIKSDLDSTGWIIEEQGVVYSVFFLPIPDDQDQGTRKKLEKLLLSSSEMKSKMSLILYGAGSVYSNEKYSNREAVAGALVNMQGGRSISGNLLPGVQSLRSVVGDGVASIDWISMDNINVVRENLPKGKDFDDAYCSQLYSISRSYFDVGDYENALIVLKEMHRFDWMDPQAYLDASECFIRLGKPKDGLALLDLILENVRSSFSVEQMERAGDLRGLAGDDIGMKNLHEEALILFRSQR